MNKNIFCTSMQVECVISYCYSILTSYYNYMGVKKCSINIFVVVDISRIDRNTADCAVP